MHRPQNREFDNVGQPVDEFADIPQVADEDDDDDELSDADKDKQAQRCLWVRVFCCIFVALNHMPSCSPRALPGIRWQTYV